MTALLLLIPVSLLLGLGGLAAFVWTVSDNQYDDPEGHANRILDHRFDQQPVAGEASGATENRPKPKT
jgi:cbb3-type cytochrome oxidase maturation protein